MNMLAIREAGDFPVMEKDHRILMRIRTRERWLDVEVSPEFDLRGYRICREVATEDLERVAAEIRATIQPAEDEDLVKEILRLKVLTISKAMGDRDMDLMVEIYVEKLRKYPADAVMEAFDVLGDECKFFPAWSELRKSVEWRCAHRIGALKAIERELDDWKNGTENRRNKPGGKEILYENRSSIRDKEWVSPEIFRTALAGVEGRRADGNGGVDDAAV